MSFWNKIKIAFQNFMTGRNGPDDLSLLFLIVALILSLISGFGMFLGLLSIIAYSMSLFRIFSRNVGKRRLENQRYLEKRSVVTTALSQAWARLKNIRKYKYFNCPQCNAKLRLPRKVGEVRITCGKCHYSFKKKA